MVHGHLSLKNDDHVSSSRFQHCEIETRPGCYAHAIPFGCGQYTDTPTTWPVLTCTTVSTCPQGAARAENSRYTVIVRAPTVSKQTAPSRSFGTRSLLLDTIVHTSHVFGHGCCVHRRPGTCGRVLSHRCVRPRLRPGLLCAWTTERTLSLLRRTRPCRKVDS